MMIDKTKMGLRGRVKEFLDNGKPDGKALGFTGEDLDVIGEEWTFVDVVLHAIQTCSADSDIISQLDKNNKNQPGYLFEGVFSSAGSSPCRKAICKGMIEAIVSSLNTDREQDSFELVLQMIDAIKNAYSRNGFLQGYKGRLEDTYEWKNTFSDLMKLAQGAVKLAQYKQLNMPADKMNKLQDMMDNIIYNAGHVKNYVEPHWQPDESKDDEKEPPRSSMKNE